MVRQRCLRQLCAMLGLVLALTLFLVGSAKSAGEASAVPASPLPATFTRTASSAAGTPVAATLPPLCRYGVTAWGEAQLSWLPTWRASWVMDFSAHLPMPGVSAQLAQMIYIRQSKDGCTYLDAYEAFPALTEGSLGSLIQAVPGSTWIIGNEPDRGPDPGGCSIGSQGDMFPEMYARAYHDVYSYIKQRDPTAQIANAGLVQATPGRLQYLDKMWQEYQRRYGSPMPVDIWNMHLYILPEANTNGDPNGIANIALGTNPALAIRESGGNPARCSDPLVYCYAEHDDLSIFAQQVVAMRTWMKNHGQQNKPLILAEYSLLWPYIIDPDGGCYLRDEYGNCFTPQRVNTFMTGSFDYLETAVDHSLGYPLDNNRLVQRWMWFSAYFAPGAPVSSLLTPSLDALSQAGEHFRDAVNSRPGYINLLPSAVNGLAGHASGPGGTATVALYADVLNNGSIALVTPVTVTFYADSALTQPIGSVTINTSVAGCASRSTRVYTTWTGLTVGTYPFWVKVDSTNVVNEDDETDNVAQGTVTVYPHGIYLPLVQRQ